MRVPARVTDFGQLRFSQLKIRPKLIVLHNIFFLVLAAAVYFTLIPTITQRIGALMAQDPAMAVQLDDVIRYAEWTLAAVLFVVYVLAVAALEFLVMPRYVYSPILAIMHADEASRHGNVDEEMVPREDIPGDEIGQIMRSRNATVAQLRKNESELVQTLARLEDVNQDLTRKNHLLEAAKRTISDQDRLASLGMLIAGVAHEINTPLAVLHGSVEKLMETVPDSHAQDRLERMLRVTKRLQKMSISLLDFARSRPLDVAQVDLRAVVEESWGLVAIDEKSMEVRFEDMVPEGTVVMGDSDKLIQLFVNLLRNALHAIAPGRGRIAVLCSLDKQSKQDGKDWTVIRVEDNGPGIPKGTLENVFEAFVTTRLDARGTGLGLTVAEGIVTEHAGTIRAQNRPEGGACLEVRLPAAVAVATIPVQVQP
jgi:signal transduction histidine kinase